MTSTPEDIEIIGYEQGAGSSTQQTSGKASARGPARQVVVDENHPFDLDNYISGYTGRTAYARAIFIAQTCPSLASQAYQTALQFLQQGADVTTYLQTLVAHNAIPGVTHIQQDQSWVDETIAKNAREKERLEVDLKTYASNMIKESVRMSHRELGNFYYSIGDFPASQRHHLKSREFCTTAVHVIDMCLSLLEILLAQQNYPHLSTYIYKAETALDASSAGSGGGGSGGNAAARKGASAIASTDRARISAKVQFAAAMAEMGAGRYDKAAYAFLKLKKDLGDWFGKVVLPGDIAIYGTLCALASLSRSAIKAAVLESETFGYYLEQEPYIREILDAYMGSKFKDVLFLLERYSARHYLDIHLSNHIHELARQIRNRALVLYFQPFASVHLERMAAAFGMELQELEASIVKLIEDGLVKARIDNQNKVLKAKDHDPRVELYNRAVTAGLETQASTRKLLWRMKLVQADLVIRAPKRDREMFENMTPEILAGLVGN